MVVLKSLNNSQSITADFFQEVACYKLFRDRSIVKCYGISQNPENGDYIIVMDYILGGNMKQYLQSNNYSKLNFRSFQDKLNKLHDIAKGLDSIHKKRLIHRDLHSGNILSGNNFFYIADLGLCRPANETDKGKVYGVLPYVAPEVLQGQSYSQTSDIYSFGIIAYELFANSYPYPKLEDMDLTLKVCREYRPNINEVKIPQLLKDLINRC
jgi:serine/threonine protein kinase